VHISQPFTLSATPVVPKGPSVTRRAVVAVALVALALALLGFWFAPQVPHLGPPPPHARVFVLIEHQSDRWPTQPDTVASGDLLHVAVVGEAGLSATLVNLDSLDRLVRIGPRWDEPITADPQPLSHRFEADAISGWEQLLVVAGRRPLGDLSDIFTQIDATPGLERAERIERLRRRLVDRFGAGEVAVHAGQPIRHGN
jgi:hypothetical protein